MFSGWFVPSIYITCCGNTSLSFSLKSCSQDSIMKLIIFLSLVALVSCGFTGTKPETSIDSFGGQDTTQTEEHNPAPSSATFDTPKNILSLQNFYKGAFPPSSFPPSNFLSQVSFPTTFSYKYPVKSNFYAPTHIPLSTASQGILPPFSEVIPPISQVIPPIFGGINKPVLPISPSQVIPTVPTPAPQLPQLPQAPQFPQVSQVFPPLNIKPTELLYPKYTLNYALPSYYSTLTQYPYFNSPYAFSFPNQFNLAAPSTATTAQKEPTKTPEPLPTSYGPPASTPVETSAPFEPSEPADNSASFEPSQQGPYPYEPAAPETPEQHPCKPAQEYGLPK